MSFSETDIKNIHSKSKAIEGKIYKTNYGKTFVGQKDGRLKEATKASSQLVNSNTLNGTNTQVVLEGLNSRISELEDELTLIGDIAYKTFTYDLDFNLIEKNLYEDSTMNKHLFKVEFTYDGDSLSEITVTKIETQANYTKRFSYDVDNNLINIEII